MTRSRRPAPPPPAGTFLPEVTPKNPMVAHRRGDTCSLAFKGTLEQLEELVHALQENEIQRLDKCMIAFQGTPRQMEQVVYAMQEARINDIDVGVIWRKKPAPPPRPAARKKND